MTKLYVIRHGESEANFARRFAGQSDVELTGLGLKQARISAEYLKDKNIDCVYSSPLKRAYNTAKATADLYGLPIIVANGVKEINAGEWEMMPISQLKDVYREEFWVWRNDIGKSTPNGGESVIDMCNRCVSAFKQIAKENRGKNIVIATHATPIRALGAYCMGVEFEDLIKVPWAPNASITRVCYRDGKFFDLVYGYGEHLGDSITFIPKDI